MKQEHLNRCMLLSIHKDKTDLISLVKIANEFSEANNERLRMFIRFSNGDYVIHNSLYTYTVVHDRIRFYIRIYDPQNI